jgi:hypothetical protein
MKRSPALCFFPIILFLYFLSVPQAYSQNKKSVFYFYRLPNYAGSGSKMTILLNGNPVVRLRNGSFFRFESEPGNIEISTGFGGSSKIVVNAEPGETYYVKAYINMGFWSGIPILELVNREAGRAVIAGNMLLELQPEQITLKKPTGSFGLTLGGGVGFESVDLFTDENNDDVSLSTGGGFTIGGEFNHNLGKRMNLSFQAFFQGSTLSRPLKNASASFNRMGITLTPSVIIPIKGGEQFRLLFGAGGGIYPGTKMKIDASEVGGENATMNYNTPVGLHVSLMFNGMFSEKGELGLGLKYYNIAYEFVPDGSTHTPTIPKLQKPNGSGIDFIIAYYFKY